MSTSTAPLTESLPSPVGVLNLSSTHSNTKRRLSAAAAQFFRNPLLRFTSGGSTSTSESSSSSPLTSRGTRQPSGTLHHLLPSKSAIVEDERFAAYQSRFYRPEKMPHSSEILASSCASTGPAKLIHRFLLHKEIGSGRYGKVYLATDTDHNETPLALKVMEKRDAFLDELEHLLNLRRHQEAGESTCPFLVRLVNYCELRYVGLERDTTRYLLATRLAEGGSLRNVMRTQLKGLLRLTEAEAAFYLLELTEALSYLHSLGIVHQDVKPDNVLLCADGHIVLADFGLATLTSAPYAEYRGNIVCKSNHMPPEVQRNESVGAAEMMNHAVDWFSVGVLLFRLVAASYPPTPRHSSEEWKTAFKKFHCSRPLANLLQRLMEKEYKFRLGASTLDGEDIFSHAFVKRVLPSVLQNQEDAPAALRSVQSFRQIIRDKRLRPVFQPYSVDLRHQLAHLH